MKPLLNVRNLSKHFAGLTAVENVSFIVPQGAIVGLIGPNGAGKTTCFNMIAGAMSASAGTVNFDGEDITNQPPEQICRRGLARTFQVVRPLADLTALDNVIVGALLRTRSLNQAREQAAQNLAQVGLGEKLDILAGRLTLPERKMLELAKALATKPKLVLLDEVMAGLRLGEADVVIQVLRDLNAAGLTIMLVEHVMRILMALADEIVVLHHGRFVMQGSPQIVANDARVIESYLGSRANHAVA